MPFKSQAQRGFLYANHPDVAAEFEAHTPKGAKLPARVGKGDPMPDVEGKKFPYTPKGEAAAKAYAKKTGKKETYDKKAYENSELDKKADAKAMRGKGDPYKIGKTYNGPADGKATAAKAKPRQGGDKYIPQRPAPNFGKGDPGGVMSKSAAAKKAVAGEDMGKPGPGFDKVAAKAGKEYGSAAAGKRVAGAVFQKMRAKGQL